MIKLFQPSVKVHQLTNDFNNARYHKPKLFHLENEVGEIGEGGFPTFAWWMSTPYLGVCFATSRKFNSASAGVWPLKWHKINDAKNLTWYFLLQFWTSFYNINRKNLTNLCSLWSSITFDINFGSFSTWKNKSPSVKAT